MKALTFSRHFPKGHPKAGQPTLFVEKIWNSLNVTVRDQEFYWDGEEDVKRFNKHLPYALICNFLASIKSRNGIGSKPHTIRAGSRFKPGDMASLRVWSDKPYRSKQIEFAQVEVKKVWSVEIYATEFIFELKVNGVALDKEGQELVANNDGLSLIDFYNWFNIHPKKKQQVFTGQIICWNESINY